jgi:hypothetical protein
MNYDSLNEAPGGNIVTTWDPWDSIKRSVYFYGSNGPVFDFSRVFTFDIEYTPSKKF